MPIWLHGTTGVCHLIPTVAGAARDADGAAGSDLERPKIDADAVTSSDDLTAPGNHRRAAAADQTGPLPACSLPRRAGAFWGRVTTQARFHYCLLSGDTGELQAHGQSAATDIVITAARSTPYW